MLSGAELQGEDKVRFAQIQERLAELSQAFSEHVLDATDSFSYLATSDELAGVPEDVQAATRAAAEAAGQDGHRLTLHKPVYLPVMQRLFRTAPLGGEELLLTVLAGFAIFPVISLEKWVRARTGGGKATA